MPRKRANDVSYSSCLLINILKSGSPAVIAVNKTTYRQQSLSNDSSLWKFQRKVSHRSIKLHEIGSLRYLNNELDIAQLSRIKNVRLTKIRKTVII